jgi:hypothetical protein
LSRSNNVLVDAQLSIQYSGTSVTIPPLEQRQTGLLNEVVVLVRFISTEISITGSEASGLVSEVGLLIEVVFNQGSTVFIVHCTQISSGCLSV